MIGDQCRSVNVTLNSSSQLVTLACQYAAKHLGPCADDHGNHWIRVAEYQRLLKIEQIAEAFDVPLDHE